MTPLNCCGCLVITLRLNYLSDYLTYLVIKNKLNSNTTECNTPLLHPAQLNPEVWTHKVLKLLDIPSNVNCLTNFNVI